MRVFVVGQAAYRTEIHLFQAEKRSAAQADLIDIPPGTAEFFRIDGRADGTPAYALDWTSALAEVRQQGGTISKVLLQDPRQAAAG